MRRLPHKIAGAIAEFVAGPLTENPHRCGKALVGDLAGLYSARRGAYRVVYRIQEDEKSILIVAIDHRNDVYRQQRQ